MFRPILHLCFALLLVAVCRAGEPPALVTHETVLKGLRSADLNLKDPLAVFAAVFAQLPDTVHVLPTENYYYWQLFSNGREIRGNIRLPSGQREKGILCVGYSEFDEFPDDGGPVPEISESRYLSAAEGVRITCPGPFSCEVIFRGKRVLFRLLELAQLPPNNFSTGPEEQFIARTFDESGCGFFLIFNTRKKYFLWILNEEQEASDHFHSVAEHVLLGRRTGFVFWIDAAHGQRKVLAGVRAASVRRNDWFDGPFDQLADNYADQSNIRKYLEAAFPSVKGRIDKWGYFTDTPKPERVAITPYGTWETVGEAVNLITKAGASADPLHCIARGGKPE